LPNKIDLDYICIHCNAPLKPEIILNNPIVNQQHIIWKNEFNCNQCEEKLYLTIRTYYTVKAHYEAV